MQATEQQGKFGVLEASVYIFLGRSFYKQARCAESIRQNQEVFECVCLLLS